MLANISQPLLVEQFYFLLFCNIFFYNQLAFVFYLLRDFYIVCDHIASFCFSLLQEGRSWYLSQAFFERS